MKSLIKWIVLALCLTGCTGALNDVEETNKKDDSTINNVEIINQEDKPSVDQTNETISFSESNQEESIKTEDKVVNKESKDEKQTNKTQSNDSKKENDKKQPTEEKKPDDVKTDDKQDEPQKEQEPSKPVEPAPEVPKEDPLPKEEEKKEEVVIKAYLSRDTLNYINKERSKLGLSPLTWDSSLENAVLTRAKETDQNYSHTRPNGSKWTTVLPNKDSMQLYGEIITNRFSPYDAVQAWMNSPSHKESMLDPDKTHGVVAVYNDVYVCITVKYFD